MAGIEQFTQREIQALNKINQSFEDVGDIRLELMQKAATRWVHRWDIATYLSACLAIGGEMCILAGKIREANGLSTMGKYARNFGLVTTAISWMAAGVSDSYAKDAQVELVFREVIREVIRKK